ncbi:MAG: flippase-like domain-containing protein [Acidimicrobiia bacterium]|nr:flippase-like domain-containing protein [Acidimicrobiia bacterium]
MLRVVIAMSLLLVAIVVARAAAGGDLQRQLYDFVGEWPRFLNKPARLVYALTLALPALGLVVMLALRQWRGAVTVVLGVVLAVAVSWLAARLAGDTSPALMLGPPPRGPEGLPIDTFPSLATAVATTSVAAMAPLLNRALQRAGWALVILAMLSTAFLGRAFPIDLLAGFVIGWAAGSAACLAIGSPGRRLRPDQITERLAEYGFPVNEARPVSADARASVPYLLTRADGEVFFMKAVTNENRDADLLFKLYRSVAYRGLEDEEPFLHPKAAVEHEAFVALLAAQAGVRTPRPGLAAAITPRTAVLVQDRVDARGLDAMSADEISAGTIDDIWGQVAKLREARIAHRDLRLGNMMVDAEGRGWMIDWGFAENAASGRRLSQDVAELLASLASVVGVERALAPAVARLGPEAVGEAVPFLQPVALSGATRAALKKQSGVLDDLRTASVAAAGVPEPKLERIQRIRVTKILTVVVLFLSVYLLLPEVADLWDNKDILADARWELVLLAVLTSAGTYVFDAAELRAASVVPIGLWETVRARLAASFANRFAPAGLGGAAVTIRYLQRSGADLTTATATYGLSGLAGAIVPMLVTLVCAVLAGQSDPIDFSSAALPKVLLAIGGVLAVVGLVWFVPALRKRILPPVVGAFRNLGQIFRSPSRAIQLFGSQVMVTCLYVTAFVLSCRAFSVSSPVALLGFVYLTGSTIGSASPTPGGLGAVEALLIGALISVGVDKGVAVAAVLTFRLVTFWVPVPFGALSLSSLRRTGHL